MDFSAILALCPKGTTEVFRLRRYNGRSHEHTNTLERESFYDFHIHTATGRYQDLEASEETYAERKSRYATFDEAVKCLLEDCAFEVPGAIDPQQRLF